MREIGNIIVAENQVEWIKICCEKIRNQITETLKLSSKFHIAISGGSTPKAIFQSLIDKKYLDEKQWENVFFYWVDERLVEPSSIESNSGNALMYLNSLAANFFPMYDGTSDIENSLELYRKKLKEIPQNNNFPRFDLILLGMGEDGHTASLFPKSSGLAEGKESVIIQSIEGQSFKRMTLTFPVLLNASNCMILLNGQKKVSILQEMIAHPTDYPIDHLVRKSINKTWIFYQ